MDMTMAGRIWENRSLYLGLSLVFHVLLLFYLKTSRASITAPTITFREVSYLEETPRARYRNPKVKKLLSKSTPPGPGSGKTEPERKLPESPLKPSTPEPKLELSAPRLDLSPSMKPSLEPSTGPQIDLASGLQSNVDLGVQVEGEGLDLSTGLEGADVVIASGGAGTKEILSRPEVKPSIDLSSSGGLGSGGGLPGGGGGGGTPGISLEPVGPGPEIQASPKPPPPPPPSNILEKPASGGQKATMEITGQIANRKILRRVRPRYPQRALREGREGVVQVKFFVSPEGRVRPNIVVVRSSGWPDLDEAVIRALRQWQFAPIPTREDQWGILTVVFRLL